MILPQSSGTRISNFLIPPLVLLFFFTRFREACEREIDNWKKNERRSSSEEVDQWRRERAADARSSPDVAPVVRAPSSAPQSPSPRRQRRRDRRPLSFRQDPNPRSGPSFLPCSSLLFLPNSGVKNCAFKQETSSVASNCSHPLVESADCLLLLFFFFLSWCCLVCCSVHCRELSSGKVRCLMGHMARWLKVGFFPL